MSSDTSLLLVTLGPVQEFIAAGRRTADLWSGSDLLSRLAGCAVEAVEREVGPEAFLFPARGGAADTAASLPNRFLVRVPTDRVAALAAAAEAAIRAETRAAAVFALDKVGLAVSHAADADAAARFVEVAWAAVPEDDTLDGLLTGWPDGADRAGRSYRLVEMLAGGRKALRDFGGAGMSETSAAWPSGEAGHRCTLMPALPALVPAPSADPGAVAAFWKQIAADSGGRIREAERLSAVALAKRYYPLFARRDAPEDGLEAFPSTSSFATADFWVGVFKSSDPAVRQASEAFEAAVAALPRGLARRYTEVPVPAVERAAQGCRIGQLHRRSGRLITGDPLTPETVERETGIRVSDAELRDLNGKRTELLRVCL